RETEGGSLKQERFMKTVAAVHDIVVRKLYRQRSANLQKYFKSMWNISRASVYRIMDCAVVLDYLRNFSVLPARERLCRVLRKIAKSRADTRRLWAAVLDNVSGNFDAITSTVISTLHSELSRSRILPCQDKDDDTPENKVSIQRWLKNEDGSDDENGTAGGDELRKGIRHKVGLGAMGLYRAYGGWPVVGGGMMYYAAGNDPRLTDADRHNGGLISDAATYMPIPVDAASPRLLPSPTSPEIAAASGARPHPLYPDIESVAAESLELLRGRGYRLVPRIGGRWYEGCIDDWKIEPLQQPAATMNLTRQEDGSRQLQERDINVDSDDSAGSVYEDVGGLSAVLVTPAASSSSTPRRSSRIKAAQRQTRPLRVTPVPQRRRRRNRKKGGLGWSEAEDEVDEEPAVTPRRHSPATAQPEPVKLLHQLQPPSPPSLFDNDSRPTIVRPTPTLEILSPPTQFEGTTSTDSPTSATVPFAVPSYQPYAPQPPQQQQQSYPFSTSMSLHAGLPTSPLQATHNVITNNVLKLFTDTSSPPIPQFPPPPPQPCESHPELCSCPTYEPFSPTHPLPPPPPSCNYPDYQAPWTTAEGVGDLSGLRPEEILCVGVLGLGALGQDCARSGGGQQQGIGRNLLRPVDEDVIVLPGASVVMHGGQAATATTTEWSASPARRSPEGLAAIKQEADECCGYGGYGCGGWAGCVECAGDVDEVEAAGRFIWVRGEELGRAGSW
ncbi:hypothetical protein HK101_005331, partial [Irineochytrium annulatum]